MQAHLQSIILLRFVGGRFCKTFILQSLNLHGARLFSHNLSCSRKGPSGADLVGLLGSFIQDGLVVRYTLYIGCTYIYTRWAGIQAHLYLCLGNLFLKFSKWCWFWSAWNCLNLILLEGKVILELLFYLSVCPTGMRSLRTGISLYWPLCSKGPVWSLAHSKCLIGVSWVFIG